MTTTTSIDVVDSIICGDCQEKLKGIPNESIDFILFSPPYDNARLYNRKWQWDFKDLGLELFRVAKPGAIAAVVIADTTSNFAKSMTSFRMAVHWVDVVGWRMFETLIYKRHARPGVWWNTRFRVDHEYIFLFLKGERPKSFHKEHLMVPTKMHGKVTQGTERKTSGVLTPIKKRAVRPFKCKGTVWEYSPSSAEGNRLKTKHPATFPDKMAKDLILCFSEPGDIVLDPMCGSGTTCVQAKITGRHFIGVDINEEYCNIAIQRLLTEVK